MKTYARIEDGRVAEIIAPMSYDEDSPDGLRPGWKAGDEIPIEVRFHPEIVAALVDVTSIDPKPEQTWMYDGSSFAPYVAPPPSPAEILAANTSTRDALLAQATMIIAPLQDAADLDEATDAETALLKKWKQYRVAVNREDLTQASPVWPANPST